MMIEQRAVRFRCHACWLFGILSLPAQAGPRGVLIVTGGPQYRIGSHRQFTLLARALAERGIPVLRFDYRGMGDSEGEARNYEDIGDDLDSAVQHFFEAVPELRELVLWGLCDGATAAAFYAGAERRDAGRRDATRPDAARRDAGHRDAGRRICGLVLLNPWVRTGAGLARATLRHYYWARLREAAFWRKLFSGALRPGAVLESLRGQLRAARATEAPAIATPQRIFDALARFQGRSLLILSGDDLTAREFDDLQQSSPAWRQLSAAPLRRQVWLSGVNHTFSRAEWRRQVIELSADWVASW